MVSRWFKQSSGASSDNLFLRKGLEDWLLVKMLLNVLLLRLSGSIDIRC
jgi:hypothetical protein